MPTLSIDINDAGLVVADESGVLASEPGYALVENGQIVSGVRAYSQARLKPRLVNNRYWADLSLESGSAGGLEGVRNSAELAFAQLGALWTQFGGRGRDAVLVVPSHYRSEQLGLLLGLAEECGMSVRAMVDVAVASSTKPYPEHQLMYVDASLHRVSATPLDQDAEDVTARGEHGLESTGLAGLTDSLARRAAEIFVLSTRFDPFHHAESEQLLYDRLPEWRRTLQQQEQAELALPYADDEFRVQVTRERLLGVAAGFHRSVVQLIAQNREAGRSLVVQLSDRLAGVSGLGHELARLDDAHVVCLPAGHAACAVLANLDVLGGGNGEVKLLKHLAWREEPAERFAEVRARVPVGAAAPTHVVYRGTAYHVGAAGVLIGRAAQNGRRVIAVDDRSGVSRSHCEVIVRDGELKLVDLSRHGTFVNEKRVSGETTLRPGDVIRIGSPGAELQVVTVEESDGAP